MRRVLCGYTDDGKALQVVGTKRPCLGFQGADAVRCKGTGSGGLEEMKGHFAADQPMYGYLRVTAGDEESV